MGRTVRTANTVSKETKYCEAVETVARTPASASPARPEVQTEILLYSIV